MNTDSRHCKSTLDPEPVWVPNLEWQATPRGMGTVVSQRAPPGPDDARLGKQPRERVTETVMVELN